MHVHRFASLIACSALVMSAAVSADVPTPTKPRSAPSTVSVVAGDAKVTIAWSPVAGADGYRIYRGVNGVWMPTPVGRTTGTTHTSYGLENGTMYSFTVAAYSKSGNGPLSLTVSAMPLSPPQGLTALAGDGRVTLNWMKSAGATSYTIYRKFENEAAYTELATGVLAPPFVDPGLTNAMRHQYQVRAVTAAAESELSAKVSAVPLPPVPASAPVLNAAPGNAKVTLSWEAIPGAPGYNVYRSTTGVFRGPAIGSTTETAFTSTGLVNDTTYFYTVAARNMGGEGPRAAAVPAVPVAPPGTPKNLNAAIGDNYLTLTWSPIDGAVAYNVYRGTVGSKQAAAPIAVGLEATRFIDTRVMNGAVYYYKVTAYNPGGESARSAELAASPAPPFTTEALTEHDFCGARPASNGRMRRVLRAMWPFSN
ncbi:MAG: fibronectin type III domain-containing protein [Cyanobacteria bacterium]|nr:fibronectin type III domain-containing protein [Cyanobacteriota bacterium]